jgi:hypothetical protein
MSSVLEYRANVIHLTDRGNEIQGQQAVKISELMKEIEDLKKENEMLKASVVSAAALATTDQSDGA